MNLRSYLPQQWNAMTRYQRFESVAATVMMVLVTLVIVIAIVRLAFVVVGGLVLGAMNPLDHTVFQGVFGEIVTVMIALEFNHSLQYAVAGKRSIIQTKLILLIALLAVARKFIVMDFERATPEMMLGLAAIALALGGVFWLLQEREDRQQNLQPQRNPKKPAGEDDI